MSTRWLPLSARNTPDAKKFEELHEGIPPHLGSSFASWLVNALNDDGGILNRPALNDALLKTFVRKSRRLLALGGTPYDVMDGVLKQCNDDHVLALDLADFILSHHEDRKTHAIGLAVILRQAGSAWTVVQLDANEGTGYRLERRVSEAVVATAREVMSRSGRAGEHLKNAWSMAYGREPDFNGSFLESVKAVEAAMVPVVSPNDSQATLGRMLGEMKKNKDRFKVALNSKDPSLPSFEVVWSMCQLLWKSQPDRHGTPDARTHSSVDGQAAEGALHLAVTLVQWFLSGVVGRSS